MKFHAIKYHFQAQREAIKEICCCQKLRMEMFSRIQSLIFVKLISMKKHEKNNKFIKLYFTII